jgi:RHS repeat-associated protein
LTEFLYSGEQFDSKIGQQYLRARYYDPATGRFNRLDPFFGNLNDPQSLHKYLYTYADPVNMADYVGLYPSIASNVSKNILGTYIHSYIGKDFEKQGINYFGNRSVRYILRKLKISTILPAPLIRPDLAELANGSTGQVYEIKPGEYMTFNTPLFALSAWTAIPQLTNYKFVLDFYTQKTWSFGTDYKPGLQIWTSFTRGLNPLWTLITYSDYTIAPGVLEYDLIPTPQAQMVEYILETGVALAYLQQMGYITQALQKAGALGRAVPALNTIRLQVHNFMASCFALMGIA